MIPMVMARHVRQGLLDYMDATWPMANKPFAGSIQAMARENGSVALEPFVSVKLPFRTAPESEPFPFEECLHPKYRPYVHQMEAFKRIGARESTLVATGTGSGKTECFLYPILDYCWHQRRLGHAGIKAILVYPMNALASDQARRIASLIDSSPELKGNVTAGMYVGKGSKDAQVTTAMTPDAVITDHRALREAPPDILLTNYKMLDYLLVRPKDSLLWHDNEPDTLRYMVVDELHTFDGAQGTDLACLVRRLMDRLGTSARDVCFVGTSATMGTPESTDATLSFASQVFDTAFDAASIIREDRQDATEFFTRHDWDYTVPTRAQSERLERLEFGEDEAAYLDAAANAWLEAPPAGSVDSMRYRLDLGKGLRRSRMLYALVELVNGHPQQVTREFLEALCRENREFAQLSVRHQGAALDALVALVSHARTGSMEQPRPFLDVQVQLWTKELRRMRAPVVPFDGKLMYRGALEMDAAQSRTSLPVVNCRDCGTTAWAGMINRNSNRFEAPAKAFYNRYFQYRDDGEIKVLRPMDPDTVPEQDGQLVWLCAQERCMTWSEYDPATRSCPACGKPRILMEMRALFPVSRGRHHYRCPFCDGTTDLALVGLRATPEISVMLTELVGDAYNDDDKTIVFSDSVQDASFRASAFNSRTWRFTLRNSAMAYLDQCTPHVTLHDYLDGQAAWYHGQHDDDDFIIRFTAPNMTWMDEYGRAVRHEAPGLLRQRFMGDVASRLRVESLYEFGMRSRTGRTLEKTGCAALAFDQALLRKAASQAQQTANRELDDLQADETAPIAESDWVHVVMAVLTRLRMQGAFMDRTYAKFIEEGANAYLLSNTHLRWMPGSYAHSSPRFLSTRAGRKKGFDTFDGKPYRMLVMDYVRDGALVGNDYAASVVKIVADACVEQGLLCTADASSLEGTQPVYGIDERRCFIDMEVSCLKCDSCGRTYQCARTNQAAWRGMRCENPVCAGRLVLDEEREATPSYYGMLYRRRPVSQRIHAEEHTGLVGAGKRNRLERAFKSSQQRPGDVNVLACTPTLEMGIDIGDLSTVILSSMPPQQAQYLQRVGRAGRRDGNALVLTVANMRPHDLYFYQRPDDMLGGNVQPPHVFLQATAVLERQLTAYAMDRWVHESLDHGAKPNELVPKRLKGCLDNIRAGMGSFPNDFLRYVRINAPMLLDGFTRMFHLDAEDAPVVEELRAYLLGGTAGDTEHRETMAARIHDTFQASQDAISALEQEREDIKRLKAELDAKPEDSTWAEQAAECDAQIEAVNRTIRDYRRVPTFNYLSDEGVLPNYAFPETGVTLRTILRPDRKDDEDGQEGGTEKERRKRSRKPVTDEYVRPASTAITELAPGNVFYAQGHQFTINRVVFDDTDQDGNATKWRLCPNCSHTQPDSSVRSLAACPACGDPRWADAGQVRQMLRISTVISEMTDRDSMVDDTAEDRSQTFFLTDTLVDVDRFDVQDAWKLVGGHVDFGFEYAPHGTIREINFGQATNEGAPMTVAGNEQARQGFVVCRHCGKLATKDSHGNPTIQHTFSCPERLKTLKDPQAAECLFLYRQITTETLRLLVPGITDMSGGDTAAASFTAAVMLGLRERFGNIDHLAVTLSNEPVADNPGLRKTYLVVYDTIPGGTGYLKQLAANRDELMGVLKNAYRAMQECAYCNDPDNHTDGCYNCLYAYRQAHDLELVSRQHAMDMLGPLVNDPDAHLARIETVGDVPVNRLVDSRLEEQFLVALGQLRAHPLELEPEARGARASLVRDSYPERHGEGYTLSINGQRWAVFQQVAMGPETVAVPSKPDFLFEPLEGQGGKPIAVFTDGLTYHAPTVGKDSAKREALRQAGYEVWTMTYDDVIGFINRKPCETAQDALQVNQLPGNGLFRRIIDRGPVPGFDPGRHGTMDLFAYRLSDPQGLQGLQQAAIAFGNASLPKTLQTPAEQDDAEQALQAISQALGLTVEPLTRRGLFALPGKPTLTLYTGITAEQMQNMASMGFTTRLMLDDRIGEKPEQADEHTIDQIDAEEREAFKHQWAAFWHLANLMQYSDSFRFVTSRGLGEDLYAPIRTRQATLDTISKDTVENDPAWNTILSDDTLDYYEPEVLAGIEAIHAAGVRAPKDLGYELVDAHDQIVGEAVLAWPDATVAYIPPATFTDWQEWNDTVRGYRGMGWDVIDDTDDAALARLRELVGGKEQA